MDDQTEPDLWVAPVGGPSRPAAKFRYLSEFIGAGEEIRTLDPNLGKVVLYH